MHPPAVMIPSLLPARVRMNWSRGVSPVLSRCLTIQWLTGLSRNEEGKKRKKVVCLNASFATQLSEFSRILYIVLSCLWKRHMQDGRNGKRCVFAAAKLALRTPELWLSVGGGCGGGGSINRFFLLLLCYPQISDDWRRGKSQRRGGEKRMAKLFRAAWDFSHSGASFR